MCLRVFIVVVLCLGSADPVKVQPHSPRASTEVSSRSRFPDKHTGPQVGEVALYWSVLQNGTYLLSTFHILSLCKYTVRDPTGCCFHFPSFFLFDSLSTYTLIDLYIHFTAVQTQQTFGWTNAGLVSWQISYYYISTHHWWINHSTIKSQTHIKYERVVH